MVKIEKLLEYRQRNSPTKHWPRHGQQKRWQMVAKGEEELTCLCSWQEEQDHLVATQEPRIMQDKEYITVQPKVIVSG